MKMEQDVPKRRYLPMKMEQTGYSETQVPAYEDGTECSETQVHAYENGTDRVFRNVDIKMQTQGNYSGESLFQAFRFHYFDTNLTRIKIIK